MAAILSLANFGWGFIVGAASCGLHEDHFARLLWLPSTATAAALSLPRVTSGADWQVNILYALFVHGIGHMAPRLLCPVPLLAGARGWWLLGVAVGALLVGACTLA